MKKNYSTTLFASPSRERTPNSCAGADVTTTCTPSSSDISWKWSMEWTRKAWWRKWKRRWRYGDWRND